jgi:hypothetical protein
MEISKTKKNEIKGSQKHLTRKSSAFRRKLKNQKTNTIKAQKKDSKKLKEYRRLR